jgi:hypothetical protein
MGVPNWRTSSCLFCDRLDHQLGTHLLKSVPFYVCSEILNSDALLPCLKDDSQQLVRYWKRNFPWKKMEAIWIHFK